MATFTRALAFEWDFPQAGTLFERSCVMIEVPGQSLDPPNFTQISFFFFYFFLTIVPNWEVPTLAFLFFLLYSPPNKMRH